MAKAKNPSSEGFRRNELGEVSSQDNSYGFSRTVRGYDPKEVDEYIDNLLDNYRNAQRVLDQNREEFENEKELISCEVNGLKSQKAEWEAKIAEYQAVIDDLSNKMIDSAGDEAAQMIAKLQAEAKDYEKREAENQEIIDNLSKQLGESQMIINTLNVKSNSNIKEVEELNAKIRELQAVADNSADAEAVKAELSAENMRLSDQIAELQRVNDELQQAGGDNQAMVDQLSRENEENLAMIDQLNERITVLQDNIVALEAVGKDANAELEKAKAEADAAIADANAQIEQARAEAEAATADASAQIEAATADANAQIEQARAENDELMRRIAESDANLTELTDKIAILEANAADYEAASQDANAQYEQARSEADELARQVAESESTINNLRDQLMVVNDMVKENEDLRANITSLEAQVADYDNVINARDTLQEQVEGFQARFDEQQKMVDERNEALDLCVSQYAKLEETIGLLQYQVEEAKNKALGQ